MSLRLSSFQMFLRVFLRQEPAVTNPYWARPGLELLLMPYVGL